MMLMIVIIVPQHPTPAGTLPADLTRRCDCHWWRRAGERAVGTANAVRDTVIPAVGEEATADACPVAARGLLAGVVAVAVGGQCRGDARGGVEAGPFGAGEAATEDGS